MTFEKIKRVASIAAAPSQRVWQRYLDYEDANPAEFRVLKGSGINACKWTIGLLVGLGFADASAMFGTTFFVQHGAMLLQYLFIMALGLSAWRTWEYARHEITSPENITEADTGS